MLSDYYFIFVKHVIVNKVATYRVGTCHFVRNYFWKCFDDLKKLESFLMKLQRYTLDYKWKKGLHQGGLPVNILKLSALLQEGLTRAPIF